MIYLGIDPGKHGAVARINTHPLHEFDKIVVGTGTYTGLNEKGVWEYLNEVRREGEVFAVIEQVSGFIGTPAGVKHRNVASAHTTFKLGYSYGSQVMGLVAAGIEFQRVTPQKWQRSLGIPPRKRGEKAHQHKAKLLRYAKQLFPTMKLTLEDCDAMLLAEYARFIRTGLRTPIQAFTQGKHAEVFS